MTCFAYVFLVQHNVLFYNVRFFYKENMCNNTVVAVMVSKESKAALYDIGNSRGLNLAI